VFGVYDDFEGILTLLFYFFLYFVTVNFARKTETIYKLMTAMLISTLLISGYGLAQNFGFDFVMWNPETYSPDRFFSTLGNPNFLAAYLVETIPVLFIMFFITHKMNKKIMILAVLLISAIVLFLTKSRAGMLSFITTVVLIAIYTVYDARKGEKELFDMNKTWFIMFGIMALVMFFVPKVQEALAMIWSRSKNLFTFHGITLTPRVYIWKSAFMMFRDYPVLGTGLDTFQVMFPYYRFPIYWQLEWNGTPEKTHNIFLQVLATQGIVGMSFYLLLLTAFFKKAFNLILGEKNSHRRYLSFAIMMGTIGYLIQGLFNYTVVAYGFFFWMALGLIISLDTSSKKFYSAQFSAGFSSFISRHKALVYSAVVTVLILMSVGLVREWMGDMYYKIGNITSVSDKDAVAVSYFQEAVNLNPNSEIYWVKYGISYEKLMHQETDRDKKLYLINKAASIHEHTIEMNPMNGYNYNNLARVYKHFGETIDPSKNDTAISYYNEAIKRDPNNAYFGLDLATVYMNRKEWQKAADICQGYIKMYPDFAVPYSYMGYMLMLQGKERINDTLYFYEQAVDPKKQWYRDTTTQLSTYSNMGIIYVNVNKLDKAIDMFSRVVDIKPDYAEGWLNLARLYEMTKAYGKAADSYNEVLKINPSDTRATLQLDALRKSGKI
jgi:putative inorganic carbon (HCO3(-)) transporter